MPHSRQRGRLRKAPPRRGAEQASSKRAAEERVQTGQGPRLFRAARTTAPHPAEQTVAAPPPTRRSLQTAAVWRPTGRAPAERLRRTTAVDSRTPTRPTPLRSTGGGSGAPLASAADFLGGSAWRCHGSCDLAPPLRRAPPPPRSRWRPNAAAVAPSYIGVRGRSRPTSGFWRPDPEAEQPRNVQMWMRERSGERIYHPIHPPEQDAGRQICARSSTTLYMFSHMRFPPRELGV